MLYLHPEKSIEVMNKYRLIKNHDRFVSVADEENKNMIIVSQIQKNDRVGNEVLSCASDIVVRGRIFSAG